MRILAGHDQEYDGTLQLSPGIKVGYLQQEPVLDMKSTVLENIAPALAPTKAMLTEFEEVSLGPCMHQSIATTLSCSSPDGQACTSYQMPEMKLASASFS